MVPEGMKGNKVCQTLDPPLSNTSHPKKPLSQKIRHRPFFHPARVTLGVAVSRPRLSFGVAVCCTVLGSPWTLLTSVSFTVVGFSLGVTDFFSSGQDDLTTFERGMAMLESQYTMESAWNARTNRIHHLEVCGIQYIEAQERSLKT